MRVAELEGAKLDYWVAKAEGLEVRPQEHATSSHCSYSISWGDAGPIIEKHGIGLFYRYDDGTDSHRGIEPGWEAYGSSGHNQLGPNALTAAMRYYVASKFGEDVPD